MILHLIGFILKFESELDLGNLFGFLLRHLIAVQFHASLHLSFQVPTKPHSRDTSPCQFWFFSFYCSISITAQSLQFTHARRNLFKKKTHIELDWNLWNSFGFGLFNIFSVAFSSLNGVRCSLHAIWPIMYVGLKYIRLISSAWAVGIWFYFQYLSYFNVDFILERLFFVNLARKIQCLSRFGPSESEWSVALQA